jgi:hypothetical protein
MARVGKIKADTAEFFRFSIWRLIEPDFFQFLNRDGPDGGIGSGGNGVANDISFPVNGYIYFYGTSFAVSGFRVWFTYQFPVIERIAHIAASRNACVITGAWSATWNAHIAVAGPDTFISAGLVSIGAIAACAG